MLDRNRKFAEIIAYYKENKPLFEEKSPGLGASKKLEKYCSIIKTLAKLKDQHAEAKKIYDAIAGRDALQTMGPIPEIDAIKQTEEKLIQTAPVPDFTMEKRSVKETFLTHPSIRQMYKPHCQKYFARNSSQFPATSRRAIEEKQSEQKLFESLIEAGNILMHPALSYLIQEQGYEYYGTFMVEMHKSIIASVLTEIRQENDKIRLIPQHYSIVGKK